MQHIVCLGEYSLVVCSKTNNPLGIKNRHGAYPQWTGGNWPNTEKVGVRWRRMTGHKRFPNFEMIPPNNATVAGRAPGGCTVVNNNIFEMVMKNILIFCNICSVLCCNSYRYLLFTVLLQIETISLTILI